MKTMCGVAISGGRVTSMVSRALGRADSSMPISRQSRGAQAPAATTTAPASMRPDGVSTPTTALSRRTIRVTGVHGSPGADDGHEARAREHGRAPHALAPVPEDRVARPRQPRVLLVRVVHAHERARPTG